MQRRSLRNLFNIITVYISQQIKFKEYAMKSPSTCLCTFDTEWDGFYFLIMNLNAHDGIIAAAYRMNYEIKPNFSKKKTL